MDPAEVHDQGMGILRLEAPSVKETILGRIVRKEPDQTPVVIAVIV
jgi:hypothetical protein